MRFSYVMIQQKKDSAKRNWKEKEMSQILKIMNYYSNSTLK